MNDDEDGNENRYGDGDGDENGKKDGGERQQENLRSRNRGVTEDARGGVTSTSNQPQPQD